MSGVEYRFMSFSDLWRLNEVNLDPWTENFAPQFYADYLARWPELCYVAEYNSTVIGYHIGKLEKLHGHVSALSIAPSFRSMGIATELMNRMERHCEELQLAYIDLYVKAKNKAAVELYKKLGYYEHERLVKFYERRDDALDMRKLISKGVSMSALHGRERVMTDF